MTDIRGEGRSTGPTLPVQIRALLVQCGHCRRWAPSKMKFWYLDGFERARSRGAIHRCDDCCRATPAGDQKYRAYLENGEVCEGH